MEWTTYRICLALAMVVTGSINTLSTKWADQQMSEGLSGSKRLFNHPYLQSLGMFLGEMSCLFVYFIIVFKNRNQNYIDLQASEDNAPLPFNPLVMLPAALLDMFGTTTMYIGLNLTYAASFQMLRGAVIIFTAILSVLILKRRIRCYMWIGMALVFIGLLLVGVADIVLGKTDDDTHTNTTTTTASPGLSVGSAEQTTSNIITGDIMIILAQIIVAGQMVYEEKFISKYNVPALKAVGLEGLFGFIMIGLLLIPFYYIHLPASFSHFLTQDPDRRIENIPDAFEQMKNNHIIIFATIGNIVSIAFFNFCGISVTKSMSATTRMVLDSCRTLIIWLLGYAFRWQEFVVGEFFTQLLGFVFLVTGMMIYNNLVILPLLRQHCCNRQEELTINASASDEEPDESTPILRNATNVDSEVTPVV